MNDRVTHYRGTRDPEGQAIVVRVFGDGREEALNPRLDLYRHSPTGLEWGYRGSGPAQLALAIVSDAIWDDERALRVHQGFKDSVVAYLPRDLTWEIAREDVLAFLGDS